MIPSPLYIFSVFVLSSNLSHALPAENASNADANAKSTQPLLTSKDFINFKNDDLLHGKFLGFTSSGKIIWKNPAAEKNIAFLPEEVRKIVVNEGKLTKPFTHTSYVTLTNHDTIPGKIVAISDKLITLQSDYAGEIAIPKNTVSSIDFQPLGSKIQFRGPFTKTDWESIPYNSPSTSSTTTKKDTKHAWTLKNFSLQNTGTRGSIMLKQDITEKSRYIFKVRSLNHVMPSFFIAADKVIPPIKADENEKKKKRMTSRYSSNIATSIGTSLVFSLNQYNSSLNFYSFNDKGIPQVESVPNMLNGNYNNRQKPEFYLFDIRLDKLSGTLLLYLNEAVVGQWDIRPHLPKLKGNKMGFTKINHSNATTFAISDIVVSTWNGITTPAISMKNNDRDTILLTNGTDRYSGKTLNIGDNKLQLQGVYAKLAIPTDQIQSLYFAKKNQTLLQGKTEKEISVRFYGTGRITGKLTKGANGTVSIDSKALGKLSLDTNYISSYEFEDMDYAYEIIQ